MANILLLFLFPLVGSLLFALFPQKVLATIWSAVPLLALVFGNWIGEEFNAPWFLGIDFHLKIDSLSYLFLLLTALLIPLSLLTNPRPYVYPLVLLLQALLIGFFTAQDIALFTIFWEAMLLPLVFLFDRQKAAMQFLIYMIAGSALMVAGVLGLYFSNGTFAMHPSESPILFAIFLLAFAVKTPLFPFHGWLPNAYTEASTAGSILLAGILSKAGIYGVMKIGIGLFGPLMEKWGPLLLGFAIAGVFYGGLAAWRQNDYKRLIAYSSLSHVNFILAGLFVWNQIAHQGAIFQSLNHGITISALFLVAYWLETRIGTTSMNKQSGMAKSLPNLCWLTFFFILASVAVPLTNTFIGELMVLFGLFEQNKWVAALLALSIILSVMYMLRWMQKVYFGPPAHYVPSTWTDIGAPQFAVALPLAILILWWGIYPNAILRITNGL